MDRRVVLSDHAIAEARRRGIDEATVVAVATNPEQRELVRPQREVRQSRFADPAGGRLWLIRVIVDCGEHVDTVVTAYRTSKVSKYWRAP